MSAPRIPGPPAYRRPDVPPAPVHPASSSDVDLHQPRQDSAPANTQDLEALLRQQLRPQLPMEMHQFQQMQQQHAHLQQLPQHHHMAPPPPPHLQLQTPHIAPSSGGDLGAQASPAGTAQSPTSEAATPRSAKGQATRRGKVGTASRASRRRKSTIHKDESDISVSEEEFTMEGVKTKSGRKVHKPAHFNPAQKTPSRRRGPYRRNYDARICKICQRGHSPQSNMIVFCDGCNTPYHQLCHDPPIDDLVIAITEAEWYCVNCAKQREERPLTMGLSGETLTDDEKRTYLASLPMTSLVEIIFTCEKHYPDLPIYDPQTKAIVERLKQKDLQSKEPGEDGTTPGANGEDGTVSVTGDSINWEEMVVRAVATLPEGTAQPKTIFEWLGNNYPALSATDVRSEAQPFLQSALHSNRLTRDGHIYHVNPEYKPLPGAMQDPMGFIAPGSGIKLLPETEEDVAMLVDDDSIAFSHRFTERPTEMTMAGLLAAEVSKMPTINGVLGRTVQ